MQLMRAHAGGAALRGRPPLKLMERALDIDFDVAGPGLLSAPACVLACISFARFAFLRHDLSWARTKQPNYFETYNLHELS